MNETASAIAVKQRDRAQQRVSVHAGALDVADLPSFAFSHRSVMWWGTMGVVAIEGTVFALAVMTYFYLRSHSTTWPPSGTPPALLWGTVNTIILLLSEVPNQWTKHVAEKLDLRKVRIGLMACLLFALAFLAVRVLEFRHLNAAWDRDAYGSAVWMLLGLHTVHLLTDFVDSAVLAAMMFSEPLEGKRYVDVSENAMYWHFVVLAWLPIYAVVYWAPRL